MKRSRFAVGLILLLLAFACFLSIPVFSSELPWDADGGSDPGTNTDTTTYDDGNKVQSRRAPDGFDEPGWFIGFMSYYSHPFMVAYLLNWPAGSSSYRGTAGKADHENQNEKWSPCGNAR